MLANVTIRHADNTAVDGPHHWFYVSTMDQIQARNPRRKRRGGKWHIKKSNPLCIILLEQTPRINPGKCLEGENGLKKVPGADMVILKTD